MVSYLSGSAYQTVCDNPITSFRQLVQQYSTSVDGKLVSPEVAKKEAIKSVKRNPVGVAFSGLGPRLIGVGFKRIPKFGFLLGFNYMLGGGGTIGPLEALGASLFSAPFINPIRVAEKQQRAFFRETGKEKPMLEIFKEARKGGFKPLIFTGIVPLMMHSCASAMLGLAGQPDGDKKTMTTMDAIKELAKDTKKHGIKGFTRGMGLGMGKGIISLSLFHQGRIAVEDLLRSRNEKHGWVYQSL